MKRLFLLCLSAVLAFSSVGCSFFGKSRKPKENPAIAEDVEESFRQRWIEKRMAELTGKGTSVDAARQQAANEFREQYGYTKAAQEP